MLSKVSLLVKTAACKFNYVLRILHFSATRFLVKVKRTYTSLLLKVEAAIVS